MSNLSLSPDGESNGPPCPCCGNRTRTVWGYVYADGDAHAVYFARWARGHQEHGMVMIVSIGGWGGDPAPKMAVGLDCRMTATGPGFMVIDAAATPWGDKPRLGTMLARADVLGSAVAQDAFAIADLILDRDDRVREFLRSSVSGPPGSDE